MMDGKEVIARRIAQEIRPGMVVNLGVGLPTLASPYVAEPDSVLLHGENGVIGLRTLGDGEADADLIDPGGNPVSSGSGACFFDSVTSFAIVRGGHLDLTIVGGLQVDQSGTLANWSVPGKRTPGMGGGMDLVNSSRRVIVAMLHCHEEISRIVSKCTLPITSTRPVDLVITELAVLAPIGCGFFVSEHAPGVPRSIIENATQAKLHFPDEGMQQMNFGST